MRLEAATPMWRTRGPLLTKLHGMLQSRHLSDFESFKSMLKNPRTRQLSKSGTNFLKEKKRGSFGDLPVSQQEESASFESTMKIIVEKNVMSELLD